MPTTSTTSGQWASGDAYQRYMGRWSRLVASQFLEWLTPESGKRWLDIGSGAGALSEAILTIAAPESIVGIDPSAPFVAYASQRLTDARVRFEIADAQDIPLNDQTVDYAVSGLCLNFIPDPARALSEMKRVTKAGGTVAAYVWDYADGMHMLRHFWDAARQVDPGLTVDEAHRNPLCAPDPLRDLFVVAGLSGVKTSNLEIEMRFADFDDYWKPFGDGTGPAPAYLRTLGTDQQKAIESALRESLPAGADGSISLPARAWAVRGART